MRDYEISEQTLALIPQGNKKTRIYERDHTFMVSKPIAKIMEDSCEFFGSSLDGRQKGTARLLGVSHKAPVVVEESKSLIFFPTTSPRLAKCSWISLKNIDSYYQKNKKVCIKFKNNTTIELPISFGIIDNQILRATRLESVVRKRQEEVNNSLI